MLLSESLIWSFESCDDISGIKVLCAESICDDVANFFMADFSNKWKEALSKVEQAYGNYESECVSVPTKLEKKDYGFFIHVYALDITYNDGNFYDSEYGFEAFYSALKNTKAAYPQLEYDGYICGVVSDLHAGNAYQNEISTRDTAKACDFVGEFLSNIFASEMYIPEDPLDAEDINFAVTGKLKFFENHEDITEYIENLGGNVTDSISKETNYLISNNLNSTTSKSTKARELGIPVISEQEFISIFGDSSEFDLEQSDFWERLAEELTCNEDFEETIEALYAYSNWIKKSDLDRAVRTIINIASEYDEDIQEELVELVKQLESDEDIDKAEEEAIPEYGYTKTFWKF